MKFLLDENLSPKLATALAEEFPNSLHVRDLGLHQSPDEQIWEAARRGGYVIISKDDDFHQRSFLFGHPPKVVWLRLGNCATSQILQCLCRHIAELRAFEVDEQASFLVVS